MISGMSGASAAIAGSIKRSYSRKSPTLLRGGIFMSINKP